MREPTKIIYFGCNITLHRPITDSRLKFVVYDTLHMLAADFQLHALNAFLKEHMRSRVIVNFPGWEMEIADFFDVHDIKGAKV